MKERNNDNNKKDWTKEIELVDCSEYHKDGKAEAIHKAKRALKFVKETFFHSVLSTVKTLIFFISMIVSLKIGIIEIWLIIWGFFIIFDNLGKRQKGTLSAYSVFNKNFEKPIGSFENPYKGIDYSKEKPKTKQAVEGTEDTDEKDLPLLYFTKFGKFANKECYCGSLQKYKKCCHPLDVKFGPLNQARTTERE